MSAPINLNKFRKERGRALRRARADENSIKFGQTKAEKDSQKSNIEKLDRHLDGHKKEP